MSHYLYMDIETLPAIDMTEAERWAMIRDAVPGNYKKPESIERWIKEQEEADENAWTRTAVDPLLCRVYVISWAEDDGEPFTLCETYDGAEGDPVECDRLERRLIADALAKMPPKRWVAHNAVGFDFPILRLRALKYRLPTAGIVPHHKWGDDADDTAQLAAGARRGSGFGLDRLARFFGVPGKLAGMHGSKVYPTWRAGDHGRVMDYCAADVVALRGIHERLEGVS